MHYLNSINIITKQYATGEEPVLVECDDNNSYICKYARFAGSSNKLICELYGGLFAKEWNILTPDMAIVEVKKIHIPQNINPLYLSKPILGSRKFNNVIDITPSTISQVAQEEKLLIQLLNIALFDFWVANEDRNANNANLMYDVQNNNIISIDYGCIFNTATFDYHITQLTETDSIINSDLFKYLVSSMQQKRLNDMLVNNVYTQYAQNIKNCIDRFHIDSLMDSIPCEWNIDKFIVINKIKELFEQHWIDECWENFNDCIKNAISYE